MYGAYNPIMKWVLVIGGQERIAHEKMQTHGVKLGSGAKGRGLELCQPVSPETSRRILFKGTFM